MTWSREDKFLLHVERYRFDCGECSAANGFCQIDTRQDAPYFGMWTNPSTLTLVIWCEGDYTRLQTDSICEYRMLIQRIARDHKNDYRFGIDPGYFSGSCAERRQQFIDLGLGEFLH